LTTSHVCFMTNIHLHFYHFVDNLKNATLNVHIRILVKKREVLTILLSFLNKYSDKMFVATSRDCYVRGFSELC